MPLNKAYVSADDPISAMPGGTLFSRTWFRFFELIAKKTNILTGDTSSSATGGGATLPAQPEKFMSVIVDGKTYKIPLYNE